MVDLPTDLAYGKVVGRYLTAIGDGPDVDSLPDGAVPVGLTITIKPKAPVMRTANPSALVVRKAVACTIDETGALVGPDGTVGVWLVAGVYSVTYASPDGDYSLPGHDIEVLAAHTDTAPLDLAKASPPPAPVTASQYADLDGRLQVVEQSGGTGGAPEVTQADLDAEATARTTADATLGGRLDAVEARPVPDVAASDLAAHAADSTSVHGIADTATLVLTTDPRLSDARPPTAHTSASVTDFVEAVQDVTGAMVAAAGGTYDDAAGTVTLPSGGGATPGARWTATGYPLSGRWYTSTDANLTANRGVTAELIASPISFSCAVTVDRIGMQISTAAAGSTIRLGLHNTAADGLPGTVLLDAGLVDTSTVGDVMATISQPLEAGKTYWMVFSTSLTWAATLKAYGNVNGQYGGSGNLGRPSPAGSRYGQVYYARTGGRGEMNALTDLTGVAPVFGDAYALPSVRIT